MSHSTELMETIARQALQITRLERENAKLQTELEVFRKATAAPPSHDASVGQTNNITHDIGPPDSRDTILLTDGLTKRCAELEDKFAKLESQHEKCGPRIEDALKKYREGKATCKAWRDYLEKHEKYSKDLKVQEARMATSTPEYDGCAPQMPEMDPNKTIQLAKLTGDLASPATSAHSRAALIAFTKAPSASPHSSSQVPFHRISSSQTTVVEPTPEPEPQLNSEQDDNEYPVVVSARSLKRRAVAAASPEPAAQRIKQEPIELSSDDYVGAQQQPTDDEEYDLDGLPVNTPAKNRVQKGHNQQSRHVSCEPARSAPILTRGISSRSEGDPEAWSMAIMPVGYEQNLSLYPRRSPPTTEAPVTDRRTVGSATEDVLQSLSINVPTPKRNSERPRHTELTSGRHREIDNVVAFVSEGGEGQPSLTRQQTPQSRENRKESPSFNDTDHRLDDLLNKPTHERTPTLTGKALGSITTARKNRLSPHLPTPVSELKRVSPVKHESPAKSPKFPPPHDSPPPIEPDEEPLRARDPRTLRLEDFRINPKYLGTDFAFADTLRGRDARRNLQTCTRADCCGGALQKAVAFGGPAVSGNSDAEALEAYLGRDWEIHIGAYGADKRKDIIMQAHVHVFANKHGKHRQAFARRSTPPGFWDTDFPTTQEAAQHRKKAEEMEKEEVMERWRQAVQGEGRWKLRDE